MNLKYIVNCMLLVAIYAQPLLSSQNNDVDDFEVIQAHQRLHHIFNILEKNSPNLLNEYLNLDPQAINARTPYETDKRMCYDHTGRHEVTFITDGCLPLHEVLASKDVACIQVVLNHMYNYDPNNTQKYHAAVQKELNLGENDCHHWEQKSFLETGITAGIEDQNIWDGLLTVSSQKDKNEALYNMFNNEHLSRSHKNYTPSKNWMEKLVQAGADINHRIYNDTTILHAAVTPDMAHPAKASELIKEHGAKADLRYGKAQNTLIHEAVKQGSWTGLKDAAIGVIVKSGVSVNTKNAYGQTPTHVAFLNKGIFSGYALAKGYKADLTRKDNNKKTPFDYYQEKCIQNNHSTKCSLYDCTDLINDESDPNDQAKNLDRALKDTRLKSRGFYLMNGF